MAISYEWDYETIDSNGDIQDHCFNDSLGQYVDNDKTDTLCLVRNEGNEKDGVNGRYWAYVKDGKLPECFSNEMGEPVNIKIPVHFRNELRKYLQ